MTQHTPGPWMIDPKYLSEVQTADDKTICSAWHQYASGQEITVTGVLECSLEESAANARLIAAAPDLLSALVAMDEAMCAGFETQEARMAGRRALIAARAAIAKATA